MGLINQTAQSYYDGNDFGNYQFVSLTDIINQFMFVYVGEDKIIPKVRRTDVAFHAQRALAELSFDTFKSCKAQEITVPASLQMILPQDYVNYTKVSQVDSAGVKHLLYPTSKTSNPTNPLQNSGGDFSKILQAGATILGDGEDETTLDSEYKDIIVGMLVSGPYIPTGTVVLATSNFGGLTTVQFSNTINIPSGDMSDVTLTFTNVDGSLMLPQNSSFIIEDLIYNNAHQTITAHSGTFITSDLEVGMIISHKDFVTNTTITHVNANSIVVSNPPLSTVTFAGNDITFVSGKKTDSTTWSNYKSGTPSENQNQYDDDTYWPLDGSRYGLDPQHAQANGSFYIDCQSGKIHFSSNVSGKTVILDYISDSLGTDGEMQVHKFAEEAMYKWISHAILAGNANVPEYQVNRFKKERFAAVRTAKLRLSSLKLEELTQILRGKSKQIKH
jgi:hypothetical protein